MVTAVSAFALLVAAMPTSILASNTPMDDDRKAAHVLNRLTYGIRPGDVERVKKIGVKRFIEMQLNAGSIEDSEVESRLRPLEPLTLTTAELFAKYPNPAALIAMIDGGQQANFPADGEMTEADRRNRRQKIAEIYRKYDILPPNQIMPAIIANRVVRAAYSERQLQEVMVDFWQNHFNVFAGKNALRWYIPSYERDVLRKHALGNFKDLLTATAKHPAMLFYLDNFESVTPNVDRRAGRNARNVQNAPQQARRQNRGLNENYARELMELHTLGVDGGYTQADIVEVAKCFSGWTIADPRGYRRAIAATGREQHNAQLDRLRRLQGVPDDLKSGEFYFNERWHDTSTKTILGKKINDGGINDGLRVIEMLAAHPSTAKNIARKLAVKFVSDDPDPKFVERIAAEFMRARGDIKATLRMMFNDNEFFADKNYRAKIKTPFELAVSTIRVLDGQSNGGPAFASLLNKLGEVPYGYQAPTGYPDTAADWVNAGALLERLNFVIAVAGNRVPGTRVDISRFAGDGRAALDRAIRELLNGDVSKETRAAIESKLKEPLPDATDGREPFSEMMDLPSMVPAGLNGNARQTRLGPQVGDANAIKVVSLVLGTPEFQRQ